MANFGMATRPQPRGGVLIAVAHLGKQFCDFALFFHAEDYCAFVSFCRHSAALAGLPQAS